MSKQCDIVRDILPLYVDGACSEASAEMVKEHLNACADCNASPERWRYCREIGITGAMFDELKEIIEEMRKGVPLGYFTSQWFGNFY